MIDFRCSCSFKFSVPAELAGDMMQCPQCHRLVDVPRFSELGSLEEDGLYKVDEAPPPPADEKTIESIARAFTRARFDDEGYAIDNRGTFAVGPEPVPVQPLKPELLKYDPITGELIEEIKIVEPTREALPVARPVARVARSRRKLMDEPTRFELAALPALLLKPMNVVVMVFLLIAHALAAGMIIAIFTFYWTLAVFWLALHAAIIAHYGNVIDETGPTNRAEMPVPLRSMDWGEDIFVPFFRTMLALAICYLPGLLMLFTLKNAPPQIAIGFALSLVLAGTLIFPAVWLTTMTSGTILNLRPDRVWTVIEALGAEYILVLLTWVIAGVIYLVGGLGIQVVAASVAPMGPDLPPWARWYYAWGALLAGIYLMHLLGWQLGTLYRKHHMRFNWVLQRFNKDELVDAAPTGFAVKKLRQPPPQAIPAQPFPDIEP